MQRITELRDNGIWQALDITFAGPQIRNMCAHFKVLLSLLSRKSLSDVHSIPVGMSLRLSWLNKVHKNFTNYLCITDMVFSTAIQVKPGNFCLFFGVGGVSEADRLISAS
jgi:hypothetical protein